VARSIDRHDARKPEIPGQVGVDEGRDKGTGGAVDVDRDVDPLTLLEVVERCADLLHRLVRTVEGRAEHRDDTDRVLVAEFHRFFRGEVEAVSVHRDEPHLDVPVLRELLPADLHIDAHDEVRTVRGLPASRRRFCQRRLSARAPSIAASLEPVVEHPVACAASGACHRRLRISTQRTSSAAVCGYSSLSIMFLSRHSAISFSA
jgi:hypothetical protein